MPALEPIFHSGYISGSKYKKDWRLKRQHYEAKGVPQTEHLHRHLNHQ